jgi:aspartyl-tRNA(Asn)/glutamyl-tRNA(Gln) amidotransferase subunit C
MADPKQTPADFTVDTGTVKHMALLVRLGLSEDEAREFSGQFSAIIDYFHLLSEVNTTEVPPASEQPAVRNVIREDVVKPSLPRADFLKNVPHPEGAFVRVPTVFDEE